MLQSMTYVYIYWYPKFFDKSLMGLERFEVGKKYTPISKSLMIYEGIDFQSK